MGQTLSFGFVALPLPCQLYPNNSLRDWLVSIRKRSRPIVTIRNLYLINSTSISLTPTHHPNSLGWLPVLSNTTLRVCFKLTPDLSFVCVYPKLIGWGTPPHPLWIHYTLLLSKLSHPFLDLPSFVGLSTRNRTYTSASVLTLLVRLPAAVAVGSSLQFTLKDFGLVPLLLIISLTPICGRLSAKPFFPLNLIGLVIVTRTPRFLGLFPPVGPFAKGRLSRTLTILHPRSALGSRPLVSSVLMVTTQYNIGFVSARYRPL